MYKIRIKETKELKEFYNSIEPEDANELIRCGFEIEKIIEGLFNDTETIIEEVRTELANKPDVLTRFSEWEKLVIAKRDETVSELIPLENLIIEKV